MKLMKQDNVQVNSESVQCRVFQTRKVFEYWLIAPYVAASVRITCTFC